MRIAIIDPFYDVSHSIWSEGLKSNSSHEIEIYSLSAVHWKWKMASGAITLANRVNNDRQEYDLFVVTDMLDVGLFKSLLAELNGDKPVLLYFHENQLTYPKSEIDADTSLARDHHYAWINFTSALVSDHVSFNSNYHKSSFLSALPSFIDQFPAAGLISRIDKIESKCSVLSIGLDLRVIKQQNHSESPIILWNHRWESDKNPDSFYRGLQHLSKEKIDFRLIVCGKEYQNRPVAFDKIELEFSDQIIHWGYAQNRTHYWELLSQADISLVTSKQDFFGISVVESIHAGCIPILPNRLAYPEHIPRELQDQVLFDSEDDMFNKLTATARKGIDTRPLQQYVFKYDWSNLIHQYDQLFTKLCR